MKSGSIFRGKMALTVEEVKRRCDEVGCKLVEYIDYKHSLTDEEFAKLESEALTENWVEEILGKNSEKS